MNSIQIRMITALLIVFFLHGCDSGEKSKKKETVPSTQPRNSPKKKKETTNKEWTQEKNKRYSKRELKRIIAATKKTAEKSRKENKKMLAALQVLVNELKKRHKGKSLLKYSGFNLKYSKEKDVHYFTLYREPLILHSTFEFYVKDNGEIIVSGYY